MMGLHHRGPWGLDPSQSKILEDFAEHKFYVGKKRYNPITESEGTVDHSVIVINETLKPHISTLNAGQKLQLLERVNTAGSL